jgi:hypothetical protein
MNDKKKEEVINLLTNTIKTEKLKGNQGNSDTIEKQSIIAGKNKGIKNR